MPSRLKTKSLTKEGLFAGAMTERWSASEDKKRREREKNKRPSSRRDQNSINVCSKRSRMRKRKFCPTRGRLRCLTTTCERQIVHGHGSWGKTVFGTVITGLNGMPCHMKASPAAPPLRHI